MKITTDGIGKGVLRDYFYTSNLLKHKDHDIIVMVTKVNIIEHFYGVVVNEPKDTSLSAITGSHRRWKKSDFHQFLGTLTLQTS